MIVPISPRVEASIELIATLGSLPAGSFFLTWVTTVCGSLKSILGAGALGTIPGGSGRLLTAALTLSPKTRFSDRVNEKVSAFSFLWCFQLFFNFYQREVVEWL